jgi:hypothetical protein
MINKVSVTVAISGAGAASVDTAKPITGEILKITYDKGTVNAATTIVTTAKTVLTGPVTEQIDSFDVNGGSANRYPAVALLGTAAGDNKWGKYVVDDYLNFAVSGGAASKTCTVHVYYK